MRIHDPWGTPNAEVLSQTKKTKAPNEAFYHGNFGGIVKGTDGVHANDVLI